MLEVVEVRVPRSSVENGRAAKPGNDGKFIVASTPPAFMSLTGSFGRNSPCGSDTSGFRYRCVGGAGLRRQHRAENRDEYTVIGDPDNEAARLADHAKASYAGTVAVAPMQEPVAVDRPG